MVLALCSAKYYAELMVQPAEIAWTLADLLHIIFEHEYR